MASITCYEKPQIPDTAVVKGRKNAEKKKGEEKEIGISVEFDLTKLEFCDGGARTVAIMRHKIASQG